MNWSQAGPGKGTGFAAPRIAYLINCYPAPSHSFIRREIAELEKLGLAVERFSIRAFHDGHIVDPDDRAELSRTRYILEAGFPALALSCLWGMLTRPRRWLKAAIAAARLAGPSDRGFFRHLAYLCEACLLARWLRAGGAQHLHAHFGSNPTSVALLCHIISGITYSFTAHGTETFDSPGSVSIGAKIGEAAFAVSVSDFGRGQLYRWCEVEDWARIHVVRCGVDHDFLGLPPSTPPAAARLACVARLSKEKAQLLLVEAAARLAAEGLVFELVLVGDGDLRPEIEALVERHGLQRCVRLLGWGSNEAVREELVAARALVLPSLAEGLPVVIMEALALGRPVISTYVAGIPELVEPGVSGWLVPPGSVDDLTEAMRAALTAPVQHLESMGRAGAARVALRHDAAREAGKLAQLFQNVIAAEKPRARRSRESAA